MFRKLVSNLAFSPALVGQLGFYAQRLRKEEATRRVGLIFTALALVIQSFAVFSPPEPANAASPNDFVYGGVRSVSEFLGHYESNTNNLKDLFTVLGITRSDIANASQSQINSKNGFYSWGQNSHFSYDQGERPYTIKTSSGGMKTYYARPLSLWDSGSTLATGSYYNVFTGVASGPGTISGQQFYIMLNCGNLALKFVPPAPRCPAGTVGTYPDCTVPPKMCTIEGKTHLYESDPNCKITPKCTISGKTTLAATDPNCKPDPVATCTSLKIDRIVSTYQLNAKADVQHGATVKGYTYVIKRNGAVIDTFNEKSTALTHLKTYSQTKEGTYTVTLTVKTSIGDKTSPDCEKTFTIAPPEKCAVNANLLKTDPACQPCPGDPTLWIKDEKCAAKIIETKTAKNITRGDIDATTTSAQAGDKIIYTLTVQNVGKAPTDTVISERIADVAEYAKVIDNGGGIYNEQAQIVSWPKVTIPAGHTISRMFTVQIADTIPAMGQGISDKTSYDCRIDNTFGNTVTITIDCPTPKVIVEQTVSQLPHTGPSENMIFAGAVFTIVGYFYARSRQVKKEIRLIRRDLNAGTI